MLFGIIWAGQFKMILVFFQTSEIIDEAGDVVEEAVEEVPEPPPTLTAELPVEQVNVVNALISNFNEGHFTVFRLWS